MSFTDLGLPEWLNESLANMAITKPSAIQKACIPEIIKGKDCIGGARTGSGKTIAFAAPMLAEWSKDPCGIFGLVLTPTRELAIQIAEQFTALGANMNIRVALIYGGVDMVKQSLELQKMPHFVIATPGRLADHIRSSGEDTIRGFRRVKYVVMDEADRLLTPGFVPDLKTCMDLLPDPSKRQTLLFTATVTDAVRALKGRTGEKGPPFIHEIASDIAVPSTLTQSYLFLPGYVREAYLWAILTHPDNEKKSAIIFVNRTQTAETLRRMLMSLDVKAASLHSDMRQQERVNALGRFRAQAARVLVATDVASRGLDIPTVEMVINFDLPADADDYIHRVGRTARAGRKGQSISLVTERDVTRVTNIEERVGSKMEKYNLIDDDKVVEEYLTPASTAKRQAVLDMEADNFGERKRIQRKKAGLDVDMKSKVKKPKRAAKGKADKKK